MRAPVLILARDLALMEPSGILKLRIMLSPSRERCVWDAIGRSPRASCAVVIRTRASGHIGDLFRGLAPPETPPAPGTVVELGEGTLFVEHNEGTAAVGLLPDDWRPTDWLDPVALCSVHEQTVRLEFPAADLRGEPA
jgi:hypothetical protein